MSNALAIANVTAVFRQIIETAVNAAFPSPPPGWAGISVRTERPTSTDLDARAVRLFLYQVTPNAALRNNDLPTRAARGNLIQRATAAIDLHYLLTFYGNEANLEPQIMLGAVIRDIHARPVVPTQIIRDATGRGGGMEGSNLAEQAERIKFTQSPLSLEELSKLWSVFFQAPYALSIAYQAAVVLIDGEESPSPALPVLTRGLADHGINISVGPFPAIESIHIGAPEDIGQHARVPSYPSAQVGDMLTITGNNLGAETVSVDFNHIKLGLTHTIVVHPGDRTGTELTIRIIDDAAASTTWAAGLYTVTVSLANGGPTRTTNQLPLPFSPKITNIAPVRAGGDVTLTISFSPAIRSTQRASLLILDREVEAGAHTAATTLQFNTQIGSITDEIVRLRVDGVDSLPFRRQAQPLPPLVFDESQRVTI